MSSYPIPKIKAYKAAADYSSAGQYYFVSLSADDTVVVCSTKGEEAIGVLMNAPESGKVAEVALPGGGALIKLGGTVARNQQITTDASGTGIIPDDSGQHIAAQCIQSGVSGDVVAANLAIGETFNAEA